MSNKNSYVLKNLWYSLSANFITMSISIILTLIVPKLVGVETYGYYQLYIFYSSYVGFLHFGIIDGIYLTIGGQEYEDIDKQSIGTQFWFIIFINMILTVTISVISYFVVTDPIKFIIVMATCISSILINGKTLILFVLQATNNIKEYASFTRLDRLLFIFFVISYLFIGGESVIILVFLDILSKFIVLSMMIYKYQDLVIRKLTRLKFEIHSIIQNIKTGISLTLSYIASLLIIGVIRLGIESKWDIVTFGKISLTLSLSNMVMIFINAAAAIMFPILRRADESNLKLIYLSIRNAFVPLLFGVLLFFEPIKSILMYWLPEYSDSLYFMAILFPIFIYESKVSLLTNSYLKTLRKEKKILESNLIALILSVLGVVIIINIFENLLGAIFLILFCLIIRSNYSEIYLCKLLRINKRKYVKDLLLELLLTIIFVWSAMNLKGISSISVYGFSYLIYLVINRNEIKESCKSILFFLKKSN